MPFIVTHPKPFSRDVFDDYIMWLGLRRIDWTNTQRVTAPNLENRWLHVWANCDEADAFFAILKKKTRDK